MTLTRFLFGVVLLAASVQTGNCVVAATGWWYGDGSIGGIELVAFALVWASAGFQFLMVRDEREWR